jgi:hypothetical protein
MQANELCTVSLVRIVETPMRDGPSSEHYVASSRYLIECLGCQCGYMRIIVEKVVLIEHCNVPRCGSRSELITMTDICLANYGISFAVGSHVGHRILARRALDRAGHASCRAGRVAKRSACRQGATR